MGFFQRLFSKKGTPYTRTPVRFGRFHEGLKTEERFESWDVALDRFTKDDFLGSLEALFHYLNDPENPTIQYVRSRNKIEFTIEQGSSVIVGWSNPLEFQATSDIFQLKEKHAGLMRTLLESNYSLDYCKYVLKEKTISLKFNSKALDGAPSKIYSGLRELALLADKQDDLILNKFSDYVEKEDFKITPLPAEELTLKANFLRDQLDELKANYQACALDPEEFQGAYSYLILNTCYRLDYLLKPEGELMDLFENIHQGYFDSSKGITPAKNKMNFITLLEKGTKVMKDLEEECYEVNYTFGYTTPVTIERVQDFVLEEVDKMDWYIREGHREIGLAIPGYIVGYSLFHYALPRPLPELFALYYEITEYDFFKGLGFSPILVKNGGLEKAIIIQKVKKIFKKDSKNAKNGPILSEIDQKLRFDSVYHFSKSFLQLIGEHKFGSWA
ncbi:MAG: hypothetical protein HKN16_07255 [Saprospiraceae bacterium]|nr:hypothetical protein [Saprospiraceae bacterium]